MNSSRRKMLATGIAASAVAATAAAPSASAQSSRRKQVHHRGNKPGPAASLYSEAVSYGDFVFISGHGVAEPPDVSAQTTKVLDLIEAALKAAGSSLDKAVKCNVYLANIDDYAKMNEAYRGRFGAEPPVRTTVAIAAIPLKGALVEIELIAHR